MADFSSLNGYSVKDAQARQDIATLQTTVNTDHESRIENIETTVNTDHESRIENIERDKGDLANLNTIDKSSLVNAINEHETDINNLNNDTLTEMVVFGDSWSDLNVTDSIWSTAASNELSLNLHNYAVNGAGFVAPANNLISTQIQTATADTTYNKNKVKYVVLCGGINDYYLNNVARQDLENAIETAYNSCKLIFPKAKVLYVNNLKYPYTLAQSNYWQQVTKRLLTANVLTLNQDGFLGKQYFNNTLYHLTQFGQKVWASNIVNALSGGVISNLGVNIDLFDNADNINRKGYIWIKRIEDMLLYNITFWGMDNATNSATLYANKELSWTECFTTLAGGVNQLYHLTLAQINNNNTISIVNNENFNADKVYTINGVLPMPGSDV